MRDLPESAMLTPMPPNAPILVTGASGNVGRTVVDSLLARQIPVRVGVRDPERTRDPWGEAVSRIALDFQRPETFAGAVTGAAGLFLMRPPAIADVRATLLPLVDVARAQGVGHTVFLSVAGAGTNQWVPHHTVERHLMTHADPMRWTILRPGFFAQNLGDAYRQDIREEDRLYVPAGAGRVAFVDVRDLGTVTAGIFADPAPHVGQAYTLTGPEAVGFDQVAGWLSESLGRPIRYEPASILGYVGHLRRRHLPWGQIAVQTILHAGLRLGQAATVDPTLGRLLGRPPHTVRDVIRDTRTLWRREA